ncbi:MAG: rhodanese-like domain-containing protein [Deltaproteobacteria bacterium]|nr:rhodanese-like domain-containing protein [Deltaproteobacteria bacterium]
MHKKTLLLYVTLMAGMLLLAMSLTVSAASVPRMSTDELKSQLGDADLVVLDVRGNWDWVKAKEQILGSDRVSPGGASQWAANYPKEKTIVLYCT